MFQYVLSVLDEHWWGQPPRVVWWVACGVWVCVCVFVCIYVCDTHYVCVSAMCIAEDVGTGGKESAWSVDVFKSDYQTAGVKRNWRDYQNMRNCSSISAFCLNEKGWWRTSVLCTHIHEFLYISHLFHFIYLIVISNIWFCMLDVIIGRHTWNCQNTHAHTHGIHTHRSGLTDFFF